MKVLKVSVISFACIRRGIVRLGFRVDSSFPEVCAVCACWIFCAIVLLTDLSFELHLVLRVMPLDSS